VWQDTALCQHKSGLLVHHGVCLQHHVIHVLQHLRCCRQVGLLRAGLEVRLDCGADGLGVQQLVFPQGCARVVTE
jgi:hypothetical protein